MSLKKGNSAAAAGAVATLAILSIAVLVTSAIGEICETMLNPDMHNKNLDA
ncbi:MAG: hypothetical protein ACLTB5_09465 [Acutalibacteraceae bacterium]